MEQTTQKLIEQYGLPGIVIIGLTYGINKIWMRYVSVQERVIQANIDQATTNRDVANALGSLDAKIDALMAQRSGSNV